MGSHISTYTVEVSEKICEQIASGTPLREICRQPGMPAWRTVYDWIDAHPDFATRIARARVLGHEAIAQEALDIADNSTNDYMTRTGLALGTFDSEHVQRSKLRVETRLKLLAKWSPKLYGDKIEHEHKGVLNVVSGVPTDDVSDMV